MTEDLTTEDRLAALAGETDDQTWRPRVLDPARDTDRAQLDALLDSGAVVECHDAMSRQLADLIRERHPGERLDDEALVDRVAEHLGGRPRASYGRWVWYPWSRRLVHLLPADEFRELREARNRDKITAAEQARLRGARVGVVGLSVGRASAVTLALEGVCGALRLADHDTLDLSNLNRIRAGVHELGVEKSILVARELAEIDPDLAVQIERAGITAENLDAFLTEGGELDLVVEECDSVDVKLRVRSRCRELGIPVVMETSDRGMLDVERFDLEPERPILHGLLGDPPVDLASLSPAERLERVFDVVGRDTMSPRLRQMLPSIGRTLRTWPQLGSDVALGGAVLTYAARRILLGEPLDSGRYFVDVERILTGGT